MNWSKVSSHDCYSFAVAALLPDGLGCGPQGHRDRGALSLARHLEQPELTKLRLSSVSRILRRITRGVVKPITDNLAHAANLGMYDTCTTVSGRPRRPRR